MIKYIILTLVLFSSCIKHEITIDQFQSQKPYEYVLPLIESHYMECPTFVYSHVSKSNRLYVVDVVTIIAGKTNKTTAIMTSSMKVISIHYANE